MLTTGLVRTGDRTVRSNRAIIGWLLVTLLVCGSRASAELGTIDTVPAATLLLPYFEVDLANPLGMTTTFTIVNSGQLGTPFPTAASAAIAHVTLWTDLGIPTFAFDVYFTGFDTEPIDLRAVFNGVLPVTASDGQDFSDTISPQGIISQDVNFAACNGTLPYAVPALTPQQITDLRNAHTGHASALFANNCGARDLGDNIARGFVTIDTVFRCTSASTFPSSPDYFTMVADSRNLFAGNFAYIDGGQNFGAGSPLIAIEADPSGSPIFGSGSYTFYGRFVGGNGSDRREPLATKWAVDYQDKPAHDLRTQLIVWRDPIVAVAPFACGGGLPAPFPLAAQELIGFDTAENPDVLSPAQQPFPVVAMRVGVNGAPPSVAVAPRAGWLYLSLNSAAPVLASPFSDQTARQSAVMVITEGDSRFSSGHPALQLDNAFAPPPP